MAVQRRQIEVAAGNHTEREIASTDQEIDDLVYALYRITDEERRIIGGD
jgi:hypothetical protein